METCDNGSGWADPVRDWLDCGADMYGAVKKFPLTQTRSPSLVQLGPYRVLN